MKNTTLMSFRNKTWQAYQTFRQSLKGMNTHVWVVTYQTAYDRGSRGFSQLFAQEIGMILPNVCYLQIKPCEDIKIQFFNCVNWEWLCDCHPDVLQQITEGVYLILVVKQKITLNLYTLYSCKYSCFMLESKIPGHSLEKKTALLQFFEE